MKMSENMKWRLAVQERAEHALQADIYQQQRAQIADILRRQNLSARARAMMRQSVLRRAAALAAETFPSGREYERIL